MKRGQERSPFSSPVGDHRFWGALLLAGVGGSLCGYLVQLSGYGGVPVFILATVVLSVVTSVVSTKAKYTVSTIGAFTIIVASTAIHYLSVASKGGDAEGRFIRGLPGLSILILLGIAVVVATTWFVGFLRSKNRPKREMGNDTTN